MLPSTIGEAPPAVAGDPWLYFEDACGELGIKPDELRNLRARGEGPPFIKVGRKLRIRRSAALEWRCAYEERQPPPVVPASPEGPWLYFEEVAALLDIKPRTLRHLRAKGEGPPFVRIGRDLRICPSAARQWFADKYETTRA